ncbi:hypothetical protein BCUN_0473 [Bifidobacterium cuniculi]|uniref:Uncharacterized protein n=1 Tax=Bifidobacterium cuniculi TaxID=1688 RepID=A0A087B4M3_9BIFI|nr:hypothetical protein BCUN_0473 [Bifidobacterium cuniculi]
MYLAFARTIPCPPPPRHTTTDRSMAKHVPDTATIRLPGPAHPATRASTTESARQPAEDMPGVWRKPVKIRRNEMPGRQIPTGPGRFPYKFVVKTDQNDESLQNPARPRKDSPQRRTGVTNPYGVVQVPVGIHRRDPLFSVVFPRRTCTDWLSCPAWERTGTVHAVRGVQAQTEQQGPAPFHGTTPTFAPPVLPEHHQQPQRP